MYFDPNSTRNGDQIARTVITSLLTLYYHVLDINCNFAGFIVGFCGACYPESDHFAVSLRCGLTQKSDTFSHKWEFNLKNMSAKTYNTTNHCKNCFCMIWARICCETLWFHHMLPRKQHILRVFFREYFHGCAGISSQNWHVLVIKPLIQWITSLCR